MIELGWAKPIIASKHYKVRDFKNTRSFFNIQLLFIIVAVLSVIIRKIQPYNNVLYYRLITL